MSQKVQLNFYSMVGCCRLSHSDQRSSPGTRRHPLLEAASAWSPQTVERKNKMNAVLSNKGSKESQSVLRATSRWVKDPTVRLLGRWGIPAAGARTANRMLWSLWLSLPFALWISSDWIGMIVLWQALSASARLLQNSTNSAHSAGPAGSVPLNVIQGGYREH